jgi:signal transduction histidine kinase
MMVGKDIGRVLLNLVGNAFYTVVRKREKEEGLTPRIEVSTTLENDFAVVRVRDNGEGMTDEVLGRIFQPFFTTKPTGQGTGLGLSLSYDIVTKGHAGSLAAESTVGEGSVLVLRLPVGRIEPGRVNRPAGTYPEAP